MGNNAELKNYLAAWLALPDVSSRCPYALNCAMRLIAYYINQRQFKKHQFLNYSFHIIDFIRSPPF